MPGVPVLTVGMQLARVAVDLSLTATKWVAQHLSAARFSLGIWSYVTFDVVHLGEGRHIDLPAGRAHRNWLAKY